MTREEKAQFCIENQKDSPAFQFYPKDWWGSRHIAAMNVEQRGIHACLIFSAWLEPNCGIPENEVCLSSRMPEDKIDTANKVLEMCWFFYDGFWFCERLLNERIKQVNISNVRVEAGSKGGRPKKSTIYRNKPIGYQLDSKQKANKTKSAIANANENEDVIESVSGIKDGGAGEGMVKRKTLEQFKPPTLQEFSNYCEEHGYKGIAERAYRGYAAADWKDSQGKQIKSWKQKLQHVWFREDNKAKEQTYTPPHMVGRIV
jgi:hypothetical protein